MIKRIAVFGDGIKLPQKVPGLRVISADETFLFAIYIAQAAAQSLDDFAFGNAWRHGDGVIVLGKCDARFPDKFSGFGVQSVETAIDNRGDDFALIKRQPAIDNAAADFGLLGQNGVHQLCYGSNKT